MTTAPNIEMIATSLRNCSLNTSSNPAANSNSSPSSPSSPSSSTSSSSYQPQPLVQQHHPPQTGDLTVELNSDVALPFHWEQCLDIRSGQVYYINWEEGTRTSVDPRVSHSGLSIYNYLSSSSSLSSSEEQEQEQEQETYVSSDTDSCSGVNTSNLSASSSFSPTESSSSGGWFGAFSGGGSTSNGNGGNDQVLVAAGCKACFMYFMVPKHVDACPKCARPGLLHL